MVTPISGDFSPYLKLFFGPTLEEKQAKQLTALFFTVWDLDENSRPIVAVFGQELFFNTSIVDRWSLGNLLRLVLIPFYIEGKIKGKKVFLLEKG